MDELVRRVTMARAGGRVERCHGITHNGSYSNAAHSWGVSMLMLQLYPEDFPRLASYCLAHDVPEAWFGDIPATTIRYVPGLREQLGVYEAATNRSLGLPPEQELSDADHAKLKACDRLDLYIWCREQQMMGNRFVDEVIRELEYFLLSTPMETRAQNLFEKLREQFLDPPQQSGLVREVVDGTR